MANSNNWGEIYKSTWWGDKAWSANTLFIDSAPPGFGLNLLKASEDMNITRDWSQFLISVAANSTDEAAPDGTDTAEKLTFTDAPQSRIQQQIALEANTTYTFSVYAKVRTGTKAFRLRNVTLGQAQQFTADTSWGLNPDDGRYSFSFTTGATAITHTLSIQNASSAGTGEVFFWGAMLNEGATAGDYVKTDASVGGSAPAPAYSGFGDAFGGVTAYYSLRQFTEAETLNAIRVRRSSDDTEQDIGFDANGDLDSTALLAFVNEEYTIADEDFSSSTGWTLGTGVSIADGVMSFLNATSSDTAYKNFGVPDAAGIKIRVSFTISNYSGSGAIQFKKYGIGVSFVETGDGAGTLRSGNGTYTEELTFSSVNTNSNWGLEVSGSFTGDIDDFEVVQITADGHVTTWYDQTGNGNDATNSTESEQPLVVSAGTLVEENGKAAIDFDGVDDLLDIGQSIDLYSLASEWSIFMDSKIQDYTLQTFQNSIINDSSVGSPDQPMRILYRDTADIYFTNNAATTTLSLASATQRSLIGFIKRSSDVVISINGSSTSGTKGSTDFTSGLENTVIGNSPNGTSRPAKLKTAELIIFDSEQSANLGTVTTGGGTGIEGNINTYFDIV